MVGIFPVIAFTYVYAIPIVQLVYERGAFGPWATQTTALAIQGLAVALLPLSMMTVLSKVFYAFEDALSVALCLFLGLAVKIGASYLLVSEFEVFGLAAATSLGALIAWTAMIVLLTRKLGPANRAPLYKPMACSLAATVGGLGVLFLLSRWDIPLPLLGSGCIFVATCLGIYMLLVPDDRRRLQEGVQALIKGRRASS
jgi:putative peptidoglycan lipid II flippase